MKVTLIGGKLTLDGKYFKDMTPREKFLSVGTDPYWEEYDMFVKFEDKEEDTLTYICPHEIESIIL